MRTVNISDLKAQLSAHIQLVKDGEEVLICDRNKPVARIVPCRSTRSKSTSGMTERAVADAAMSLRGLTNDGISDTILSRKAGKHPFVGKVLVAWLPFQHCVFS